MYSEEFHDSKQGSLALITLQPKLLSPFSEERVLEYSMKRSVRVEIDAVVVMVVKFQDACIRCEEIL